MYKYNDVNEFDKIKVIIPRNRYKANSKQGFCRGAYYKIKKGRGELELTITGKITSTPTYLGGIKRKDVSYILKYLEENLGLFICEYNFLQHSTVCLLDIKKDIFVDGLVPEYISAIREQVIPMTTKNEILTFRKDIGFEESIVIKPTTKSGKDSIDIYWKFKELLAHKWDDIEYFNQIDLEYLESCKQMIRIERRLTSFPAIRKAFNITEKGSINLDTIFNSNIDVVSVRLAQILERSK